MLVSTLPPPNSAPHYHLTPANAWQNCTDVIELGIPFTDPIADGATIQKANTKALENGVTITMVLDMVRQARRRGLKTPVLFMGYFNPMMRFGEERLLKECNEVGVNGFIMVDLPPEEAVRFRDMCADAGYVGSLLYACHDSY